MDTISPALTRPLRSEQQAASDDSASKINRALACVGSTRTSLEALLPGADYEVKRSIKNALSQLDDVTSDLQGYFTRQENERDDREPIARPVQWVR